MNFVKKKKWCCNLSLELSASVPCGEATDTSLKGLAENFFTYCKIKER